MESLFNKVVGLERLFHRTLLKLVFFSNVDAEKTTNIVATRRFFLVVRQRRDYPR